MTLSEFGFNRWPFSKYGYIDQLRSSIAEKFYNSKLSLICHTAYILLGGYFDLNMAILPNERFKNYKISIYQSGPPNIRSLICHMTFKVLLGLPRGHFGHFLVKKWPFFGQKMAKMATKPKILLAYSKPSQMC